MKRKGIPWFCICCIMLLIYLRNDGCYFLNKILLDDIQIINKYTEKRFSDETKVKKINIESDLDFCIGHNEVLKAELIVPNEEIENLFPNNSRDYDKQQIVDLREEKNDEIVKFSVWNAKAVTKWMDKTSRTIYFTVMEPVNGYTKVYIFVDRLGWNDL